MSDIIAIESRKYVSRNKKKRKKKKRNRYGVSRWTISVGQASTSVGQLLVVCPYREEHHLCVAGCAAAANDRSPMPQRHNPWPPFCRFFYSFRRVLSDPWTVVQKFGPRNFSSHSPFRSFSRKCDSFVKKSSRERNGHSLFIRAEISRPLILFPNSRLTLVRIFNFALSFNLAERRSPSLKV